VLDIDGREVTGSFVLVLVEVVRFEGFIARLVSNHNKLCGY
jgi:hypothetical protein